MNLNLPVAALRSFVAIALEGSMVGAAERVFLTQSAVSLQIKRLEELLQVPLFLRHGRSLVLTEDGRRLLEFAQDLLAINDRAVLAFGDRLLSGPVRAGLAQDLADALLSQTLATFARQNPATLMQIRVAGSRELREMVAADQLDLAVHLAEAPSPQAVREIPMVWLGARDLAAREELPLALLEEPCVFRQAAFEALGRAGRAYRIALETQSLSALRAAVAAGIGVTCRTGLGSRLEGLAIRSPVLPTLPRVAVAVEVREPSRPAVRRLAQLVRSALDPDDRDGEPPQGFGILSTQT